MTRTEISSQNQDNNNLKGQNGETTENESEYIEGKDREDDSGEEGKLKEQYGQEQRHLNRDTPNIFVSVPTAGKTRRKVIEWIRDGSPFHDI